ncbi:MAG: MATE family efflux transporter [Desulfovibrio sp.]|jgi:MATE family multidrug resistance protein|nr:MATE family efflux transporter [Desulfovibrio sp.]
MPQFFDRAEARRLRSLGIPVFIAQLSQIGMSVTDTIMTGRAGHEHMAAVAVATSIWAPLSLLAAGSLYALSPLTAQAAGAGKRAYSAHLLRQGVWLTCALSLLFMGFFYAISHFMEAFGLEPEMARLSSGYLKAVLFGLPGFMLYVNVRGFLEGHSYTRPDMTIGFLGLLLNIPCNYVLIYGKLGFPALGAVGAGISTALCFWFMACCMIWYTRSAPQFKDLRPLFLPLVKTRRQSPQTRFDGALILRILRIGLPNAIALFFEVSLFALTALLLAPLGSTIVAGHQIAMNFSALVFMLPLTLSIASAIRVGHCLGAEQTMQARAAARTALCISVFFALCIAVGTLLFRKNIAWIYTENPEVGELATQLLVFTATYQVLDGLQATSCGILRGYNDTGIILYVCLFSYWGIGLPLGYILARTNLLVPAMGPAGFWTAYILALAFGAVCYLARVRFLHKMKDTEILTRLQR